MHHTIMSRRNLRASRLIAVAVFAALLSTSGLTHAAVVTLPDPAVDVNAASVKGSQTAVLAGGCFWCTEAVFEQLAGVHKVVAGFAGGDFYADPDPQLRIMRPGRLLHWGKVAFEKWWLHHWF